MSAPIDLIKCLEFIKTNARAYAKAKAERVYLDEFKKSKRAMLMKTVEPECQSAAAQEREALAHPEYLEILTALRVATEEEERLRWLIVAAQASIDVARTLEASKRAEAKVLG